MKKSIFNLLTYVCVSILVCTFASCSNSDKEEIESINIVDTWTFSDKDHIEEMTFYANGKMHYYLNFNHDNLIVHCTGIYTINGNELKIVLTQSEQWDDKSQSWVDSSIFDLNSAIYYSFSISGNTLTLTSLKFGETSVLTRKK